MKTFWGAALALGWVASSVCMAERAPVLGQIDLPHPYYYREMYLPQLTGGPSSLAWSPDSATLIYSMAGSLWRQRSGSGVAEQLTAGAAYDYQPDWSPDGRWVIYSSYRGDALELWVLDLQSGATRRSRSNGAVNVEPRFSPDGKRIVFVSTLYNRRFHIFTADFNAGTLANVERLTGEHKSGCRATTTAPTTTRSIRCGRATAATSSTSRIAIISTEPADSGAPAIARRGGAGPDLAAPRAGARRNFITKRPTGRRVRTSRPTVRGSCSVPTRALLAQPLGDAGGGGDAFPIAYGDWDQTNPRWSPDGTRVAFISNQSGNTEIDVVRVPGGESRPLAIAERRYLRRWRACGSIFAMRQGQPASARVSVTDAGAGSMRPPAPGFTPTTASIAASALRGALFPCARRAVYRCARGTVTSCGDPARLRAPLRARDLTTARAEMTILP
jgi:TolB protein